MVIRIAGVCFPKFESRACVKSVVPTGDDEAEDVIHKDVPDTVGRLEDSVLTRGSIKTMKY